MLAEWSSECWSGGVVDQELSARLRQRSRQSGIWLGLAMGLAIFIALAGFIWLYGRLAPVFSDFVSRLPEATPTSVVTPEATPVAAVRAASSPTPVVTPQPSPTPAWQATHRVAQGSQVNFRSGPGTQYQVVAVLEPGTELRFLGEQEQVGNATWLHLELPDGRDGWIRTVDLELIRR